MDTNKNGAVVPSVTTSAYRCFDPACLASLGAAGAAPDRIAPVGETAGAARNREQVSADQKRFVNQRALLALAGYALTRSNESDGGVTYFASRWGMVRALATLVDVASFAARVGATK